MIFLALLRSACLLSWMLFVLLLELAVIVWLPWGRLKRSLVKLCYVGFLPILNVKVGINGTIPKQQILLCSNHISWLDIIILGSVVPANFIAKSNVRQWPIIGLIAKMGGTLFVDRNGNNYRHFRNNLQTSLDNNNTLVFFPEGTTSDGSTVFPFKNGIFRAVLSSKVPILPVLIHYAERPNRQREIAYINDDPFLLNLWKLLNARSTTVKLYPLPIMKTSTPTSVVQGSSKRKATIVEKERAIELANRLRAVLVKQLEEISSADPVVFGIPSLPSQNRTFTDPI